MKRPAKTRPMRIAAVAALASIYVALWAPNGAAGVGASNQIRNIRVNERGNKTVVTVSGSKRPNFTAFKLSSPRRLVIDVADSQVRGAPSVIDSSTNLISGVAVSEYSAKGSPVSRVMINFKEDAAFRVRAKGNKLVVTLSGSPLPATPAAAPQPNQPQTEQVKEKLEQAEEQVAKAHQQRDEAYTRLRTMHRQHAEVKKQLDEAEKERTEAKTQLGDAKKNLGEVQKEWNRVQRQQAWTKKRLAEVEKQYRDIQQRLTKVQQQRNRATDKLSAVEQQLVQAKQQRSKAAKQHKNAQTERGVAHQRQKEAQAKFEAAQAQLTAARQEAKRLKTEAEKRRVEALAAQAAAKDALDRLATAKNELALKGKQNKHLSIEARSAAKKVEKYRLEVTQAQNRAKQERAKRKKLERQLKEQQTELASTTRAARQARTDKSKAEEQIAAYKQQLLIAAGKASKAARATKAAQLKQRQAAKNYRQAKRENQEELLEVLRERERQTVEAKRELSRAQKAREEGEHALAGAMAGLLRATEDANRLAKMQTRLEREYKENLAKIEHRQKEALKLAQAAQQRAEKAASAQVQAEQEMEQIVSQSKRKLARAKERADAQVLAAQAKVRQSEQAKKKAAARLKGLKTELTQAEQALNQAKDQAERADRRAAVLNGELNQAKETIRGQQVKLLAQKRNIEELARAQQALEQASEKQAQKNEELNAAQKTIAQQTRELAVQKKHIEELTKAKIALQTQMTKQEQAQQKAEQEARRAKLIAEKEARRAEQMAEREAQRAKQEAARAKQRVAQQTAPTEQHPRRRTQEELRLDRLARMKGVKRSPQAASKKAPAKVAKKMPMITDIKFHNDGQQQRVIITANQGFEYTKATDDNGKAAVTLTGVGLAPTLERTLDVTDFGGVVGKVSSFQEDGKVRVQVDVEQLATSTVNHQKNTLEWVFTPRRLAKGSQKAVKPQGTKTRLIADDRQDTYTYPVEQTGGYTLTDGSQTRRKKRYTGRHVDLDFKDAHIHNILRLLADVGHVNIITSDDVGGTVTIRMRDVAWDKALDVILQTKRLGMVRDGNLIRVAPLSVLEKERELEIARRKQKMALEPLQTRLIPVSYAQASELRPRAADLLTDRGKLSVDSRTNVIIARDTIGALNQIEALIRNLDTQTPQVLIESRIVEASSTYAREIGIQWGGDFSASAATGNPTGLAFPSTIGLAGGATDTQTPMSGLSTLPTGQPNPNFAVNMPAPSGTGQGGALGITLGSIANNANLSLRLSAMEDTGTLRILSSPKILTLDNREAHIEQGTLIPYSQVSAQGVQTAFKEAKLNLTVTPHVTTDGSVLLAIKVMRDEPDWNNKGARGDPTILKREAQTELLVSDGHTAVIGGIFSRNHGMSFKKVPFFAEIPIIGWLFKKKSTSDRRSEMLIFITPRIVNRAESIGQ